MIDADVKTIAVLGAGTMGAGIAQVAAAAGYRVHLQDVTAELAHRGFGRIADVLQSQVQKGRMPALDREQLLARIHPQADLHQAVMNAEVVIEAAPESLELKRDVFARACSAAPPRALLATNTSSLSIASIATAVTHPERFVGMHFFNPVPVMKLLEIVKGPETSDEAIALARTLGATLGKDAIVVRDSPGFASSRLGLALGLEAIRMVEDGVASAQDIDKAMKLGYRHPMGPLELTDLVGLDVRLAIAEYLARELDDRRFAPPQLMREMVAGGRLGKKAGRGFYRWVDGEALPE